MNVKMLLAFGLTGLLLVGCQTTENDFAEKLTEGIINSSTGGEVNVDIEDIDSGKMTIKTAEGEISIDGSADGSGTFKMTDEDGKTIAVSSGEGEGRPETASDDMPSLPGATDFGVMSLEDMDSLSYTVPGTSAKRICEMQVDLLTGAGWTVDGDFFVFESEESVLMSYLKDGRKMALSCNLDGVNVDVVMSSNSV